MLLDSIRNCTNANQRENPEIIYQVFCKAVLDVEKRINDRLIKSKKAFVIWILLSYCRGNEIRPIGKFINTTTKFNGVDVSFKYFEFNKEMNDYCCGEIMRKYITDYYKNQNTPDPYKPWIRFKACLCETIMDSMIVTDNNDRDTIILKPTSTILSDDDFFRRIETAKKGRYQLYFNLIPRDEKNQNHLPWQYDCTYSYEMKTGIQWSRVKSENQDKNILSAENGIITIFIYLLISY